jgi:serine protease Do
MNERYNQSKKTRVFRTAAMGGTALALVLGGALVGESLDFARTSPAYADPVQVQGVAPISFADVVERVRPAVVSVRVKTPARVAEVLGDEEDMPFFNFEFPENSPMERFFEQFRRDPRNLPQRRGTSVGSGFLISDDGYVVTNNHVIDESEAIEVVFDDGSEYDATLIGTDDRTDLALLKIQDPDKKFTYVKFADDRVRVGDWVVAVGNPFGLGGTVTAGIVSANGRQIGTGPYDDFIQIDAAVNRGNSGGPAFNFRGEVIGVNTAIFSPSGGNVGIAFAIPASTAERVIDDLKDDGTIVRGWLGVQIQPVTPEIAESLRLDDDHGALIAEVQDGSPAAGTVLQSGDTILALNGTDVEDPRDLALRIAGMNPGDTAKITYWRDGQTAETDVTLGELPSQDELASIGDTEPAPEAEPSSLDDFGMALEPAEDGEGVMIAQVDPNGEAAERGLQPGDIIVSIGSNPVTDPSEVETAIAQAKDEGLKAILMRIKSGERTRFVALSFARA